MADIEARLIVPGLVGSPAISAQPPTVPHLAVVLPTFNERENISLVLARLTAALQGIPWEAIFVDDDSPDGTADVIATHARCASNIRLLHRVGRRGLASACIEGMLATQAPCIAVMDADLQHDETILPTMLRQLQHQSLDVVVGTRLGEGGSMGAFATRRVLLSRLGKAVSSSVCRCDVTDPMSGFFMLRRSFLLDVVHDLQGGGFKILVDLLASAHRQVHLGEVGYTFRARINGESKLDVVIGIEYLFLIVNKLLGGIIPVALTLYLLVGGVGLITHLTSLLLLMGVYHVPFVAAQLIATFIAMMENFLLNNFITFRDRRLRGARIVPGIIRFILACSFGAWANIIFARALWQADARWYLAGLAGIVLGSVWNLSISSFFTWPIPRRLASTGKIEDSYGDVVEVFR